MNREKRRLNKLVKEFKALKCLNDEAKSGNRYAGNIRKRIIQVKSLSSEVKDLLETDTSFVNLEFLKELERERRMLVSLTLQYGWPKTYLTNLFKKQREERQLKQKNHVQR